MSYCVKQVELLDEAGREISQQLLPDAFDLWFSSHDTGCQMTIVTNTRPPLVVWQGSKWYSHIYEFNDKGHIGGLQPDFEFAREVIEKYFDDVQVAVSVRKRLSEERKARAEAEAAGERAALIEQTKAALAQ